MSNPASFSPLDQNLPGKVLNDRWLVGTALGKGLHGSTGGYFSITFECSEISTGKSVFLKVVDVVGATKRYSGQMDVADILVKIGQEHKFETLLMDECTQAGLTRVVVCLDHGSVMSEGLMGPVLFLVFELARGDTHKVKDIDPALANGHHSDRWWLETLHHVAVGINQLHKKAIAHQDVKPSNVLFFEEKVAKIADLGRAVKRGVPSSNFSKCGDLAHSPPELFYGFRPSEWAPRFLSVDLYMLGNLMYTHFSGGDSITHGLFARLETEFIPKPWGRYDGSFEGSLPALSEAFGRVLVEFRDMMVSHLSPDVADHLTSILRDLCHPDPERRGDPKDHRMKHVQKYSCERFINRFRRARLMLA